MNNVNATKIKNTDAISEDGSNVTIAKAFQLPAAPELATTLINSNVMVSWTSPSPGFVLQELDKLTGSTNNWSDVTNEPVLAGESNLVTLSLTKALTNRFYRARQR